MAEQRYIDGIQQALHEEMSTDATVRVLGEDVTLGGPFGATKGLVEEFGESRIINTPISEATIVGMAVGAAITGLRPVLEIMFIDFITLGMDQLVNHAAKLHYMTGGQLEVPLTIRATGGVGGGYGAHHSQSLEAWFTHVPGLKVVAPYTPSDAKGLLKSAIRDNNPVLFLEHRGLYWSRGEELAAGEVVPLGQAAVRRQGTDVTILAVSKMVGVARKAAEKLAEDGIDAEVIDPRTLAPLDLDTIIASVRKTGHLVIAHEAVETGGIGAEIASRVQEAAFNELAAPVLRVGAPFAPVPTSIALEKAFVPGEDRIIDAVRRSIAYNRVA
ncbi:MAG: alpha-ketoacid dehydrogenase subunit beta [Gammaproteobacteria bacterium]|nr:alpha-ketoacid dehydrogenase subunit beta [Gammaproteobacteria bacterium]